MPELHFVEGDPRLPPRMVEEEEEKHAMPDLSGRAKDVLIVDDNYFNIEVLTEVMDSNFPHCRYETCFSGPDALKLVRRRINARKPVHNIMLFDINMPEMSGFELEREIRKLLGGVG
jgi:CheY-like chemotaxis protein